MAGQRQKNIQQLEVAINDIERSASHLLNVYTTFYEAVNEYENVNPEHGEILTMLNQTLTGLEITRTVIEHVIAKLGVGQ
jgi:hypothetical protein